MGGSKSQTVGYKYYLGEHMILCHGPIDKLTRIRVDDRSAWCGESTGGRIDISAEGLFGGESREGGISGALDFEQGDPAQGRNDYLQGQLGTLIPAFRGVVGAVLRQMYLGNNPYLKPWSFRAQRIHTRQAELTQWYDAKAEIAASGISSRNLAVCFVLDYSGSMDTIVYGTTTRLDLMQAAVVEALNELNSTRTEYNRQIDIGVVKFHGITPIVSYKYDVDDADITSLITFVNDDTTVSSVTVFEAGIQGAIDFFAGVTDSTMLRKMIFITDGLPYHPVTHDETADIAAALAAPLLAGSSSGDCDAVSSYGINIDLSNTTETAKIDNTPVDGVPVITSAEDDALLNAIQAALFATTSDMNPAHIIRECLTDTDWGMGYQEADIDDVTFASAADALYDEQMGISILWDKQIAIEQFVVEILKHIDAVLYVDHTTGLFVLKLIRDDYDAGSLLVLDESNVERIDSLSRPAFGELINSVIIKYWNFITGEGASLTVQDTALIQMQGKVISTTVNYPGITNTSLAARVAARDLKALSTSLLTCTVYANQDAKDLTVGGVFKLTWPDHELDSAIMRITKMALGDGRNNKIRITCAQDVFSISPISVVTPPTETWTNPVSSPGASPNRVVTELPYYELVQQLGQQDADDKLAYNVLAGWLVIGAERPSSDAINAIITVDDGGGYEEGGVMDFSPSATLSVNLDHGDLTWPIEQGIDLDLVTLGTHVQIEDELVRVDAISDTSITVGRGVLDTVPQIHTAGARLIFWDESPGSNQIEYGSGESIDVKVLPTTGQGTLDESLAPVDAVTFGQRALRPYPPGKFLIKSVAYPITIDGLNTMGISWAHRDRLQQTSGSLISTGSGNIGPEAGTTYTAKFHDENGILAKTETGMTGTSYNWSSEVADSEISGGVIEPWRLDGTSYDSVSLSVTDIVQGVYFKPDGAKLYVGRYASGPATYIIYEYNLSTPWLISTATASGNSKDITAQVAGGNGFFISPSGTKLFAFKTGTAPGTLFQYTLSTAWDISTATYDNKSLTFSSDNPQNIRFNSAGTRFFFAAYDENNIYQFSLSTAWDIETATYDSKSLAITSPTGLEVNNDGTIIWVCNYTNDTIYEYALSTAWDLSTASSTGRSASVGAQEDLVQAIYVGDLGRKLYVVGNSAYVYQYSVTVGSIYRLNGKIRIELYSVRDGLDSFQKHDYTVKRRGYGFNYGEFYGGT